MPKGEASPLETLRGGYQFPIEHERLEHYSSVAVLFPGQDVQKPGMFDEILSHPAGNEVMERADELCYREFGFKISEIASKENKDNYDDQNNKKTSKKKALASTEYTQPAVYVLSLALHNINKHEKKKEGYITTPLAVTGNSMGIVTAIVTSGAMSFEDGLRLIVNRGRIMQEYSSRIKTAMKVTTNATEDQIRKLLEKYSDIDMCLINSDSVFVYGGPLESLRNMTEELTKEKGDNGKNVKVLDVNADRAMHSRYTQPARKKFDEYVDSINIKKAKIPIVGTVSKTPIRTPEDIRRELKEGFDHTYNNRDILTLLDAMEIHTISEINEKGSMLGSMIRMFKAYGIEAAIAAAMGIALGFGIKEGITRHHRHHPNNSKK